MTRAIEETIVEETDERIILPIYDFSFKAIFEDNDSDVVAGFLKTILTIPEEEYGEISFKNPNIVGRTNEEKKSIVDLLLHTKSQNIVHIEMQLVDKKSFIGSQLFLCSSTDIFALPSAS